MSESRVYLRGVDLNALAEKYLRDEFINLTTPLEMELSSIKQSPQSIVTVKENINNMSYQFDLGNGRTFVCIGYKVLDKTGAYSLLDPSKEYNCMYCLGKIKRNPLGIPIHREERKTHCGSVKIFFHMIDIFCRFKCLKGELKKRNGAIYSQSMTYAAEIYNKCTGKDFSEVNVSDQRLLKIFNGPMTWEEFHSDNTTYEEKPGNMYFLPVVEFLEQTS